MDLFTLTYVLISVGVPLLVCVLCLKAGHNYGPG
jgi:hypothetical protein